MTSANWFEWNAGNMIRSMYKQIHSAISERNENMFAYSAMEIFGMYVFKQMLWFYAWLRFAGSHSLCSPWMCKYVDRQVPIMRIAFRSGGTDFFIVWQFWHINIIEFDLQYSNSSYIFLWVVEKIAFLAWWPIWPQNRNWHNANAKDVYNNVNITVDQWSWRQWNSWFISYSAIVEVIFISSEALRQLP